MPADNTHEEFFKLIKKGDFIKAGQCHYDGKDYRFGLTAQQQASCPKWDTQKDANPPLPAAIALAKADEFIATIKTESTLQWELEGLVLVHSDGWM